MWPSCDNSTIGFDCFEFCHSLEKFDVSKRVFWKNFIHFLFISVCQTHFSRKMNTILYKIYLKWCGARLDFTKILEWCAFILICFNIFFISSLFPHWHISFFNDIFIIQVFIFFPTFLSVFDVWFHTIAVGKQSLI